MRIPSSNVPIFPLSTVLFPGGLMTLKIFETRYLDMVSNCLKENVPFGVCMLVDGQEVGVAAGCYQVGTLAKIVNWDQVEGGVLMIDVVGCQRFKILDSDVSPQQLISATIQVLPESLLVPVPSELAELTDMLKAVISKLQPSAKLSDEQFGDANWVGCRLTEVLPLDGVIRQRLLEVDDAVERLKMLSDLLTQH